MRKIFNYFILLLSNILILSFLSIWNIANAGNVVVYTASGPEIFEPIAKGFKSNNPGIDLSFIVLDTGEMFQRVKAESGNPAADVTFGGSIASYENYSDLYASYDSPEDANKFSKDPDNKWHGFSIFAQPLMVNTNKVNESDYPTTVNALLDSKWQELGGIALADPNKSGTGHTIVSGLASGLGWDFTTDLIKVTIVTPGSTPMFEGVRDGEAAIGWVNEDLGAKWEAEGLPVKMIYALDAVTVQIDAYGLVSGGPNPDDAKKFIDYLGSKDGQKVAVDIVKRRSMRKDMEPPSGLPLLGDLPLFPEGEPRSVIKAKFTKIIESK